MYSWLYMVIISGILLGFWDITKKKVLKSIPVLNVLALYSLFCFIFISFEFKNAMHVNSHLILIIFVKCIVIFFSWGLGFTAIKHLPISVIAPFDTLNPLFCVIFGIFILDERIRIIQAIGIAIMIISYYFISRVGSKEVQHIFKNKYFYFMVGSALLSAVSATIDKIALRQINSGQMQFWFSLFMAILYCVALFFSQLKSKKGFSIKFNLYIPLMSLLLLVSDRIYFNAVNVPSSQIAIIMPIRKISIFISVIIGGLLFKEKNIKEKFWCICLLIAGIILVFMGK